MAEMALFQVPFLIVKRRNREKVKCLKMKAWGLQGSVTGSRFVCIDSKYHYRSCCELKSSMMFSACGVV